MKPNIKDNSIGIYKIQNNINNKVYIGKSKNIYKRMHQHLYDYRNKRVKNENTYLLASYYKYGIDNFTYYVLETFTELNEKLLKEREIFWMDEYDSNNREKGYNLRRDSKTKMITHPETSLKISSRLKKEWKNGVREEHGRKLSNYWQDNEERKNQQSSLMSRIKTKYSYDLLHENGNEELRVDYSRLVELGLKNCMTDFSKKKKDLIKFKGIRIERFKVEDIV